MPLYEFECLKCGTDFEKLVLRTADAEGLSCPDCGGIELEQKVSAFSTASSASGASATSACATAGT
jgi:putative FmdB family regulatory protein